MEAARYQRISDLFNQARRMAPDAARALLDEACDGDAPLRAEVEAWLAQDANPPSMLKGGGAGAMLLASRALDVHEVDKSIEQIGPYRLVRLIGEGGFGVVYEAEQSRPVRRRVALKVIKLGMDTRRVIARFEAERQALAIMEHPGIARVFDAGTTDGGRPYFVMELVSGEAITKYCDGRRMAVRDRLVLFRKVCNAVHHAHQKGVIHRDLKPSNILIAEHDGEPGPKIIDFGIAKATSDQHLSEATIFTEQGRLIGTPTYMSPEQAGLSAEDIDTRSDVYALGVVLYELLTGATPFHWRSLATATFGEIQRVIREEEPPRPSSRVARLRDDSESVTRDQVAAARDSDSRALRRGLRGDLDWIVMKCLEKDRARRYDSAAALADDIERHLTHEPVLAGPPGARYRLGKFVRKYKWALLANAVIAFVTVAGLIGTSVGLFRATAARRLADASAATARELAYRGAMRSASAAFRDHQTSALRGLLDSAPVEHRGWEWYFFDARSHGTSLSFSASGGSDGRRLCFSPDGSMLVVAAKGRLRAYSVELGALLFEHDIPLARPSNLTFSAPDSLLIFGLDSSSPDGATGTTTNMKLLEWKIGGESREIYSEPTCDGWNAGFDKRRRRVKLDNRTTREFRFLSFDGTLSPNIELPFGPAPNADIHPIEDAVLCQLPGGEAIGLFDLETRTLRYTVPAALSNAKFSRDGRYLATAGSRLRLWDAATGALLHELSGVSTVGSLDFDPAGSQLAFADSGGVIRIVAVDTFEPIAAVKTRTDGKPATIRFSPDGSRLMASWSDDSVHLWKRDEISPFVLGRHESYPVAVAFSPDGKRAYSGGWDGHKSDNGFVRVYDVESGRTITEIRFGSGVVRHLAVSPDGRTLIAKVAEAANHRLLAWDAATGQLLGSAIVDAGLDDIAFLPTGELLVCSSALTSRSPAPRVFEARTLNSIDEFLSLPMFSGALSGDGARIAFLNDAGACRMIDARNGDTIGSFQTGSAEVSHVLSESGARMFLWQARDSAEGALWDTTAAARLGTLVENSPIRCVRFDRRGKRIFVGCMDGTIGVWNAESLERVATLTGHNLQVVDIAVSRAGDALLTASVDGTVRLWNLQSPPARIAARLRYDSTAERLAPRVRGLLEASGGDADGVVNQIRRDTRLDPYEAEVASQLVLAGAGTR